MQMITQLKIKKELIIMLNSILLILAAVIPAVLLLVKVYRTDKLEPESPRLLAGLIIAGILSAILAIFEESVLTYVLDMVLYNGSLLYKLILFYLIVAGSEESSKYLLIKSLNNLILSLNSKLKFELSSDKFTFLLLL